MLSEGEAQRYLKERDDLIAEKLRLLSAMNALVQKIGDDKGALRFEPERRSLREQRTRLTDIETRVAAITGQLLFYFPKSMPPTTGLSKEEANSHMFIREVALVLFNDRGEALAVEGSTGGLHLPRATITDGDKTAVDIASTLVTDLRMIANLSPLMVNIVAAATSHGWSHVEQSTFWGIVSGQLDTLPRIGHVASMGAARVTWIEYPGDELALRTDAAVLQAGGNVMLKRAGEVAPSH